jgi:uncharacterized membrane protein YccC
MCDGSSEHLKLKNCFTTTKMQLDRSNFWRSIVDSEPGKPAIANGIRAAIGFGIPLVVGQLIDRRESGLFIGLIAFFINFTNVDGLYHIKAKAMLVATLGITFSVLVGLLVGNVPALAVILTFGWGLASGFAPLYGNAIDKVGLAIGLTFLFAIGHPSNLNVALMQSLLCLLGGGWAMLLSLFMWPLQPDRLLRFAVAACFEAIANYLQAFESDPDTTAQLLAMRTALETARTYLGTTQIGQSAPSWLDEQLLVLIQDGDRLFASIIALTELIENYTAQQPERSVQPLIADALDRISIVLRSISTVIAGKSASIDLGQLAQISEALTEREHLHRRSILQRRGYANEGKNIDYLSHVALHSLVMTLDKLIKQLQYAADSAKLLNLSGAARNEYPPQIGQRQVDPLLFVTEAPQSALELLRDNWTLDSAIFRHALRLSISLSLGVMFYSTTQLLMGYWVTLTIMLVLKPNLGVTFTRFFQRVGGTLLGALIAALLISTIASKPILDIIILVTVFFGVALIAVNYGSSVVFSSIFILLIADMTDVNDAMGWEFAGFRILNTCIGAGLAFGSHYLLWPNWERDRLPSQLANALKEVRTYFSDVMAVYQGNREYDSTIIRQRRRTGLAIGNAQTSFQGLLREPKLDREVVEPVTTLLVYLRRFTGAVTVLAVHLEHIGSIVPLPELATFDRQISLVLEQLADAVEQQIAPAPLPDLGATLESVQPYFQAMLTSQIQAPTTDLVNVDRSNHSNLPNDYSILAIESDQIVRRVTAIHAAIFRLKLGRKLTR